jgi:hypothetical protein
MVGRDNKGKFAKGHPFLKSQHGIKNGRKKTVTGEVKDALKLAEDAMPEIIGKMIDRATGKEKCLAGVQQAAAEYLIDRIYGKANQPISSNQPWEIIVTYGKSTGNKPETTSQGTGQVSDLYGQT